MAKTVKYTLSYPDSQKLLEESCKKNDAIRRIANELYESNINQTTKAINKLLIEAAERMGVSLYDLCFHTIPELGAPKWDDDMKACSQEISLVPVEFDLTHDGGYWKEKYFRLKERMQEAMDKIDE